MSDMWRTAIIKQSVYHVNQQSPCLSPWVYDDGPIKADFSSQLIEIFNGNHCPKPGGFLKALSSTNFLTSTHVEFSNITFDENCCTILRKLDGMEKLNLHNFELEERAAGEIEQWILNQPLKEMSIINSSSFFSLGMIWRSLSRLSLLEKLTFKRLRFNIAEEAILGLQNYLSKTQTLKYFEIVGCPEIANSLCKQTRILNELPSSLSTLKIVNCDLTKENIDHVKEANAKMESKCVSNSREGEEKFKEITVRTCGESFGKEEEDKADNNSLSGVTTPFNSFAVAAVSNPAIAASIVWLLESATNYFFGKTQNGPPPKAHSRMTDHQTDHFFEEMWIEAENALGIDTVNEYNFAITGHPKAGKSSLLNALCAEENTSSDAEKTRSEIRITAGCQKYKHRKIPYIAFWNFPGGCTPNKSEETYFMDKKLYAFDALLIILQDSFTEIDYNIAMMAEKNDVPSVFVRNKFDIDIDNEAQDQEKKPQDVKDHLANKIRDEIRQKLPYTLKETPIFVVSSKVMQEDLPNDEYAMDERKLIEHLFSMAGVQTRSA